MPSITVDLIKKEQKQDVNAIVMDENVMTIEIVSITHSVKVSESQKPLKCRKIAHVH